MSIKSFYQSRSFTHLWQYATGGASPEMVDVIGGNDVALTNGAEAASARLVNGGLPATFDGSDDFGQLQTALTFTGTGTLVFAISINTTQAQSFPRLLSQRNADGTNGIDIFYTASTNLLSTMVRIGGVSNAGTMGTAMGRDTTYLVGVTWDMARESFHVRHFYKTVGGVIVSNYAGLSPITLSGTEIGQFCARSEGNEFACTLGPIAYRNGFAYEDADVEGIMDGLTLPASPLTSGLGMGRGLATGSACFPATAGATD